MQIKLARTALLALLASGSAQAFTYDEALNGDLSGNRLAPTALSAVAGVNTLAMSAAAGDRDYFTFDVPTGLLLSSIFHHTYVSADDLSFFGMQRGTTLTEPPTGTNAGNLLAYTLFGNVTAGSEILDNLAASGSFSPAAQGFSGALAAGSYTFWVQQTGVVANYTFDFVLTPVPEPSSLALLLLGGLGLAGVVRKQRGPR